MENDQARELIAGGLSYGADFVEIYEEETRNSAVSLKDKKIETATAGIEYGIGIRLLYGHEVLYAYTSKAEKDHLLTLIRNLANSRGANKGTQREIVLRDTSVQNAHLVQKLPANAGQSAKIPFLAQADNTARSLDPRIVQVAVSAVDSSRMLKIFNSDGLSVSDTRVRTRFSVAITAEEKGERVSAHESPGALQGFEFLERLDVKSLAHETAERALRMLSSGYIEGRKMPVVLGNGFGGVIFHEACGHPLETEAIRKNASPFTGKLGQQIAHAAVTAIDDGTVVNSWGSLNIDDEGMPTEKTVLIENGMLKNYISDKVGAEQVGVRRTGSARRESYKYAPVSRMRNTYIAAGNSTLEEMLSSAHNGLYARKMGGGSVNPATGEFNFAVEEGFLIENGKVGKPVRGATLIGKGQDILMKISMVGSDLSLAAGMCGASSGSVPVTVGQPTLKVDEILVGGR